MKHTKVFFVLSILLGIFLRFYKLNSIPYPLNGDEKAFGYYGWSISHFGTDEYGNKLPLYFPSIGDYKYPLYAYLTAPLTYFINFNYLPRVVSSIASIILITLIYRFSLILFKSQKISLISSILLAISPWNITFSRTASESNLMTVITFAGFYFLYQSFTDSKNKTKKILLSLILFTLSYFTYSASRVFIPGMLLVLFLFSLFKKQKNIQKTLFPVFIFSIVLMGLTFINPASRARANNISILSRPEPRQEWIKQSGYTLGLGQPVNPYITRIFFNKITGLLREFTQRYFSHFSPEYLFFSGDIVKLNAIHNFGNFYIFEIIFFIIGISLLIKKSFKNDLASFIILSGIFLSPIAASTTVETPSAVRQLAGLPYFLISISVGINYLIQKIRFISFPIICLYLYFFCFLILSIFKIKPYYQPWTTDQGNQELTEEIWQLKDKYKYIFMPNDPYIDFLFYQQIPPQKFLSEAKINPEAIGNWNRVSQYQNIIFNSDKNCPKTGQKSALYICIGEEISPFAKIVDIINYKDGNPHYLLIDFPGGDQSKQNLPGKIKYIQPKDMDSRWPKGIFTNPNQYYLNTIL